MSDQTIVDFASLQATISTELVNVHGSELHGVLAGLICAGYEFDEKDYVTIITDLFNNGESLPASLKSAVKQVFAELWQQLLDESFGFSLMLPDDDDSLVERGHGLSVWVQGFNLGFGLQQKDRPVVSEDVKEVLRDFAEIANLSDEGEDDEEDEASEQAFFEISEYVRISALLCFAELGSVPVEADSATPPANTLH